MQGLIKGTRPISLGSAELIYGELTRNLQPKINVKFHAQMHRLQLNCERIVKLSAML